MAIETKRSEAKMRSGPLRPRRGQREAVGAIEAKSTVQLGLITIQT